MKKYLVLVLIVMVFGSLFAFGNKERSVKQEISHADEAAYNYEVRIDNMTCSLCDVAVEKQLGKLERIQAVKGDHKS